VTDYLAAGVFITLMALLYVLVLSRHGILARRLRDWNTRREQITHGFVPLSESKYSCLAHTRRD
jgi:hypothetical protein